MNGPLNPFLYKRLLQEFGIVVIASEGEAATGYFILQGGRKVYQFVRPGEYYVTNCPFCHDCRQRLWINHRWGVGPPGHPEEPLWWAATCYNESCLQGPQNYLNRRNLERRIYGTMRPSQRNAVAIRRGHITQGSLAVVCDPGPCVLLTDLPADHPANAYLHSRGFDPGQLAQDYQVKYCMEAQSSYAAAQGRIVIPVYMQKNYVGWQARFLGEADWRRVPKWYTMPGFKKSHVLYNYDAVRLLPYAIIVEGIFDAWAVGLDSVALLGKSMSWEQRNLLVTTWKTAIVVLDADAASDAQDICRQLAPAMQVVNVTLPAESDPASLPPDALRSLITQSALEQGVDLYEMLEGQAQGRL